MLFVWPGFGLLITLAVWRLVVRDRASARGFKIYLAGSMLTAVLISAAGYWGGEMLLNGTAPEGDAMRGHSLFDHNCAHCHGDDARGDEGPSLYDLKKSDARITKIIKGGIKGEMPRFGAKFNDADIRALIAFLRTLKVDRT